MKSKPKKKTPTLNKAKIEKMKRDATGEAVDKALLLFLAAAHDEKVKETTLCKIFTRANRYAEHIDDHLITLRYMQEVIERESGITIKGF